MSHLNAKATGYCQQKTGHHRGSIESVQANMSGIALTSEEWSASIEQLNDAISPMDRITRQNAALVEQAAAASPSLHGQAGQLSDSAPVFNTGRRRQ